jgi:hypothetical protein
MEYTIHKHRSKLDLYPTTQVQAKAAANSASDRGTILGNAILPQPGRGGDDSGHGHRVGRPHVPYKPRRLFTNAIAERPTTAEQLHYPGGGPRALNESAANEHLRELAARDPQLASYLADQDRRIWLCLHPRESRRRKIFSFSGV